jgi:hypothetical protein
MFSSCLGINLSQCQAHYAAQRTFLKRHGDAYGELEAIAPGASFAYVLAILFHLLFVCTTLFYYAT